MADRILAIIPARGGSKGLPGKHLQNIGGKSLIARAAEGAKSCPAISQVILSTDDTAIAAEAKRCGVEVPFIRPEELASDSASTWDVVKHAVTECEAAGGNRYDAVVLLQPTSPLRAAADIQGAIKLWLKKRPPSVVSVCESDKPLAWNLSIDPKGCIKRFDFRSDLTASRQSHAKTYRFNGAVYVYARATLDASASGVEPETLAYIMPRWRSVDVDTLEDLIVAEAFWHNRARLEA